MQNTLRYLPLQISVFITVTESCFSTITLAIFTLVSIPDFNLTHLRLIANGTTLLSQGNWRTQTFSSNLLFDCPTPNSELFLKEQLHSL